MKITVKVQMDNAAFEDDPGYELSKILSKLAKRLEVVDFNDLVGASTPLYDTNGNKVGTAEIKK